MQFQWSFITLSVSSSFNGDFFHGTNRFYKLLDDIWIKFIIYLFKFEPSNSAKYY